MTEIAEHLLTTKLYLPAPRRNLVERSALFARLQEGLHVPLTLLCAPAGFGKTTLLTSWLEYTKYRTQDLAVAWLSLDHADNDASRFWRYLLATFEQAQPGIAKKICLYPSLLPSGPRDVETLPLTNHITALLHVLSAQPVSFLLVLDDYHFLQAQSVLDAVAYLLQYLPPNLHLFIISRAEPALPLARLRARNQLLELRSPDLRFSQQEAEEFLYAEFGISLTSEELETLDAQIEGWVAGLQLAALSMQGRRDPATFVSSFAGNHRYIVDYLTDEVLNGLPTPVQDFLLATSLLERLCAPLCAAVTGSSTAQDQLEYLERANIFLLPLDDERCWYRYHHLFADVLRLRLSRTCPERVPELHLKASTWYEQQSEFAAAIEHALAAQAYEQVLLLLTRFSSELMKRGEMFTLQRWLDQVPEPLLLSFPKLCLFHAWTYLASGQWQRAGQRLQDTEVNLTQLSEGEQASLLISLLSARAALAYGSGDTSHAITLSLQALEKIGPDGSSQRAFVILHLGMAYWLQGDIVKSLSAISQAKEASELANSHYLTQVAIYSIAQLQFIQGHLNQAYQVYQQTLSPREMGGNEKQPASGFLYYGLGMLLYEWNELEQAALTISHALELSQQTLDVRMLPTCKIILGLIHLAQGERVQARQLLDAALQFVREHQVSYLLPLTMNALAQFCLATGDLAAAQQWLDACHIDTTLSSIHKYQAEYITLARLYLAQGKIEEALTLLQQVYQFASREGYGYYEKQLQMLLVCAYYARGDRAKALNLLHDLVVSAEPEGYIRLFLNEGSALLPLLTELRQRLFSEHQSEKKEVAATLQAYIQRLLMLLHTDAEPVAEHFLPDPLSERELEILRLITHGLTNQEITKHLFIAMSTLKTHINHIYSKLSVRTRTQAILQARALKLVE